MKCVVVYNPHAGSALNKRELRRLFSEQNCEISKFVAIGDTFEQRLKRCITARSIVAVVGGDGTINAALSPIIEAKATLLPLPGGTLNHFTKDLGIPQDIATALAHASTSSVRQVDIGDVNNHYFVNNSSLGLYPSSLAVRERLEDKLGKWPAAAVGALRALVSFHHYRLTIDGKPVVTTFVFVGNNQYDLSGQTIGERKRLDQGVLSVVIATAQTRLQLCKTFLLGLVGRLSADNQFDEYTVNDSLIIESHRRSLHASADGEVHTFKPPLTYRIHKKVLKVLG